MSNFTHTELKTIDSFAECMRGNWMKFHSFAWRYHENKISDEDADNFCIYYTHNRDSEICDTANSQVMKAEFDPLVEKEDGTIFEESHNHWLCGWVAGYSILVSRNDKYTEAFKLLYKFVKLLDEYPILDECLYSELEMEWTLDNIDTELSYVCHKNGLNLDTKQLAHEVERWYAEHDDSCLESGGDRGGYLSTEQCEAALVALNYLIKE
jgi:hypothetical protein